MIISKKILLATIFLGAVAGIFLIMKSKKNKTVQPVYSTEKPTRRNLVQKITASGTLKAEEQISVGSLMDGKIDKILVEDNDTVKKDQVLAIIDNGIGDTSIKKLKATLKNMRAQLEYQKKFYERQKFLFESGQIAQDTYDRYTRDYISAQATVEQTQADLEQEEKNYNNLFIKAPVDGIVIAKNIDLGQMIAAKFQATTLFHLAKDLKKMEARLDVDEADVGMAKDNQPASFTVDAFPNRKFKSKIKRIQYMSKTAEGVISYATFLDIENKDMSLRPGMTVNVEIKVSKSKNALNVPNKAFRINGLKLEDYANSVSIPFEKLPEKKPGEIRPHHKIFVLDGKTIKETAVSLGTNNGQYTEILEGITEQSNVITEFLEPKGENLLLKGMMGGMGGGVGK
ncbi:MAG: efflux RND transporter periplasmic adaptor subunit [bacterium]